MISLWRHLQQTQPVLFNELTILSQQWFKNERDATIDLSRLDKASKRAVWEALKNYQPAYASVYTDPDLLELKLALASLCKATPTIEVPALKVCQAFAAQRRSRGTVNKSRAA